MCTLDALDKLNEMLFKKTSHSVTPPSTRSSSLLQCEDKPTLGLSDAFIGKMIDGASTPTVLAPADLSKKALGAKKEEQKKRTAEQQSAEKTEKEQLKTDLDAKKKAGKAQPAAAAKEKDMLEPTRTRKRKIVGKRLDVVGNYTDFGAKKVANVGTEQVADVGAVQVDMNWPFCFCVFHFSLSDEHTRQIGIRFELVF